jgi:hypothetical protein
VKATVLSAKGYAVAGRNADVPSREMCEPTVSGPNTVKVLFNSRAAIPPRRVEYEDRHFTRVEKIPLRVETKNSGIGFAKVNTRSHNAS